FFDLGRLERDGGGCFGFFGGGEGLLGGAGGVLPRWILKGWPQVPDEAAPFFFGPLVVEGDEAFEDFFVVEVGGPAVGVGLVEVVVDLFGDGDEAPLVNRCSLVFKRLLIILFFANFKSVFLKEPNEFFCLPPIAHVLMSRGSELVRVLEPKCSEAASRPNCPHDM